MKHTNTWRMEILAGSKSDMSIDKDGQAAITQIAVSAVSRTGIEGPTATIKLGDKP